MSQFSIPKFTVDDVRKTVTFTIVIDSTVAKYLKELTEHDYMYPYQTDGTKQEPEEETQIRKQVFETLNSYL